MVVDVSVVVVVANAVSVWVRVVVVLWSCVNGTRLFIIVLVLVRQLVVKLGRP